MNTRSWTRIPSDTQTAARKAARLMMDSFCDFKWRGMDAWESFGGCIITTNLGDLSFHPGASFSNQYSQPQYTSSFGDILGVSFSRPTISFKVGLYYITEQDWRDFLEWLDPYEVSYLSFGFDKKWQYQCKVSSISQGNRFIIGRGTTVVKLDGDYYYYAETTITFELVGENCAYAQSYYDRKAKTDSSNSFALDTMTSDFVISDLDFPMKWRFRIDLAKLNNDSLTLELNYNYSYTRSVLAADGSISPITKRTGNSNSGNPSVSLFNVTFQNLMDNVRDLTKATYLYITYLSDSGILLYRIGDSQDYILNMQTTVSTGRQIVKTFSANKFYRPGFYSYSSDSLWASRNNKIEGYKNFCSGSEFLLTCKNNNVTIGAYLFDGKTTDTNQKYCAVAVDAQARTRVI